MSGDGRGVERGATAMMVARGGRSGLKTGVTTKVSGATMVDCKAAQTQQSNEGGGGLRTPSNAFRRAKRRWWGVCGMSAMAPSVEIWECSVVGAAAAVHLWGAGGRASLLEGRRRHLLTRGRPHWSRAFDNTGDGRSVERGGDDEDGSARDGSARDGELVDSRGREAEASTQQPASKRKAMGGKLPLRITSWD